MAVNDIWKMTLVAFGAGGEELITTHHYVQTAGSTVPGTGNVLAIADVMDGLWVPTYMPVISSSVTYDRTEMAMINGSAIGLGASSFASQGTTGGSGGSDGAIERALIVKRLTSFTGRKNRGRFYLPQPCAESFNADGVFDAGTPDLLGYAALVALVPIVLTPIAGLTLSPCIYHRQSNTYSVLSNAEYSLRVGIQRRRRFGVGN